MCANAAVWKPQGWMPLPWPLVWDPRFLSFRIHQMHVERWMLSTELKGLGKLLSSGGGRKEIWGGQVGNGAVSVGSWFPMYGIRRGTAPGPCGGLCLPKPSQLQTASISTPRDVYVFKHHSVPNARCHQLCERGTWHLMGLWTHLQRGSSQGSKAVFLSAGGDMHQRTSSLPDFW